MDEGTMRHKQDTGETTQGGADNKSGGRRNSDKLWHNVAYKIITAIENLLENQQH